ncbi:MAG TPA: hypothetical protein VMS54_08055 [Vicinamibacterales bacterium]|jgi:hypothetical protein|nr:hypothetical protein [Vicinamibacterales bacterium]
MLATILLVFAFVLFALGAVNPPVTGRVNLTNAGLACAAFVWLLRTMLP